MTHAHTPGPWKRHRGQDRRWYVTQEDHNSDHAIAVMLTSPHAEDDAHLIAAAPALLSALESVKRLTDSTLPTLIENATPEQRALLSAGELARAALEAAGPQPSEGEGLSTSSAKGTGGAS